VGRTAAFRTSQAIDPLIVIIALHGGADRIEVAALRLEVWLNRGEDRPPNHRSTEANVYVILGAIKVVVDHRQRTGGRSPSDVHQAPRSALSPLNKRTTCGGLRRVRRTNRR
jgi:hypothetical protein